MGSKARASDSQARVRAALAQRGLDCRIIELDRATHTAAAAAAALGCTVAQIVKTLVFRARESDRALIVLVSGADRIDVKKLSARVGEPCASADAAFVRERTGFAIGGVAPLGFPEPLAVLADEGLFAHPEVWVAGGTPHSVFAIAPEALRDACGAEVSPLAE